MLLLKLLMIKEELLLLNEDLLLLLEELLLLVKLEFEAVVVVKVEVFFGLVFELLESIVLGITTLFQDLVLIFLIRLTAFAFLFWSL